MEYIFGGIFKNPDEVINNTLSIFNKRFGKEFRFLGSISENFFVGIICPKDWDLKNIYIQKDENTTHIAKSLYFQSNFIPKILELEKSEDLINAILKLYNDFIYIRFNHDSPKQIQVFIDKIAMEKIYYTNTEPFLFSTSLKLLVFLQKHWKFNIAQLTRTLGTGDNYGPETLFSNIHRIHVGEALYYSDEFNLRKVRIWNFKKDFLKLNLLSNKKTEDWPDFYYETFKEILEPPEKNPYLVLMSGGLDSTIIASLMKREFDVPIEALTIKVPGYNEEDVGMAEIVAKYIDIPHFIKELNVGDDLAEYYQKTYNIMEEPFGGVAYFSRYLAYKTAAEMNKNNLLVGDGSGMVTNYLMDNIWQNQHIIKYMFYIPKPVRNITKEILNYTFKGVSNLFSKVNKNKVLEKSLDAFMNSDFILSDNLFEAYYAPFQYSNMRDLKSITGKTISLEEYFKPNFLHHSMYPLKDLNKLSFNLLLMQSSIHVLPSHLSSFFGLRTFGLFFSDISIQKLVPIPTQAKYAKKEDRWMMRDMAKKYKLLPPEFFKFKKKFGLLQNYQKKEEFERTRTYILDMINKFEDKTILPLKPFKSYFKHAQFSRMTHTQEYMKYNSWLGFLGWYLNLLNGL